MVLAWIACILFILAGVLHIRYPDFFIELSFLGKNQWRYWTGSRSVLNPTKGGRIFMRVLGGFMIVAGLALIIAYLL